MTNPKDGFTLTELLIVVVVIGILAALLLSVMGRANGEARRTTCLNNLKQINLGVRMYSDDSNDKAPHSVRARRLLYDRLDRIQESGQKLRWSKGSAVALRQIVRLSGRHVLLRPEQKWPRICVAEFAHSIDY